MPTKNDPHPGFGENTVRRTHHCPGIRQRNMRRGAVMPMFALMLPVLFLLAGVSINIAYMRLAKTELKCAVDAASHAGGRALCIKQSTQEAINYAKSVAKMNNVAGVPFAIVKDSQIEFGQSVRANNGTGRYQFTSVPKSQVDSKAKQANSVCVNSVLQIPLIFRTLPQISQVAVGESSIATQLDRDIALVLDKSGSMLEYKDETALNDALALLRSRRVISSSEYSNALNSTFSANVVNRLTGDMQQYASDMRSVTNRAPRHSRWALLASGVNTFLDVLLQTPQEELVSVATFSTSARLDYALSLNYTPIRTFANNLYPSGSTGIGLGMQTGIPSIMTASAARQFAAKTIVVMTDGINNVNPSPLTVTQNIVNQYNVTIHTITVSAGADQNTMRNVARLGNGKHYHSNNGTELNAIFQEIANNLPTILTQ
jgi:Flp pilus assembly protein TadG